jgi:glycosyltransferase involved in cell wall biosynthesis
MKVILSADAIRQPLTGVGRYNLELARELAAMPDIDLSFIQGVRLLRELPAPAEASAALPVLRDGLSAWQLPTEIYRRLIGRARTRALRHQPRNAILHGANYYLPAYHGPSLVTIHDVSVFLMPQHHRADRVRYMRREVALALERSALVLTVSEFSKAEIVRVLGYPAERIRVTPLGPDPRFRPSAADDSSLRALHDRLESGRYCLFVGTVEPRKNLDTLLAAFERLPLGLRRQYPLVLCGYRGWGSEALHARFASAAREGWLIYLGYVADEALPALVAGARLFVYPSLYEGFGLPLLEAMASGVPVLHSRIAALDEVAGEAGASFPPLDVEALAGALAMALQDEPWRAEARESGLARAALFSWRRCAELTRDAYREIALP